MYHGTLLLDAELAALEHLVHHDADDPAAPAIAPASGCPICMGGRLPRVGRNGGAAGDTASVRAPKGEVNLGEVSLAAADHSAVCTAIVDEYRLRCPARLRAPPPRLTRVG
eukprot:SAG11_NODE_2606_length_3176_cov_2.057524_2_plen_111_part_00